MTLDTSPGDEFAHYDPETRLWLERDDSTETLFEQSAALSGTWPTSGTTLGGRAYELPTWAPLTAGSECSSSHGPTLLPTPVVNDMGEGKTVERWDEWTEDLKSRHGNGNGHGDSLAIQAQRMLPTPTTADGKGGPGNQGRDGGENLRTTAPRLLPTPTKADGEGGGKRQDVTWEDTTRSTGDGGASRLRDAAPLLPTPKASDGEKGGPNQRGSSGDLTMPSAVHRLLPTPVTMDAAGARNATRKDHEHNAGTTLTDAFWQLEGVSDGNGSSGARTRRRSNGGSEPSGDVPLTLPSPDATDPD